MKYFNSKLFVVLFSCMSFIRLEAQELPSYKSLLFTGEANCMLCHSSSAGVLTSLSGEDIAPPTHWRSTMMAHSAKDPLWQAKVTAEVAENPALQGVIEDKCLTCHAPMARTEAFYRGAPSYTFGEAMVDQLAMSGVSCSFCHQMQDVNLGDAQSFSGEYRVTAIRAIFGPFESPMTQPMINNLNYTPYYSPHITDSAMCAVCHTLYTATVDENGSVVGTFPEQTPYLEWLNSSYPAEDKGCIQCHMPAAQGATLLSNRPANLSSQREPVRRHRFIGANTLMPMMFSAYPTETRTSATSDNIDAAIAAIGDQLANQTASLSLDCRFEDEILAVDVDVTNLTGHKLPTGFPSRRAWIRLEVLDADGHEVFLSGEFDDDGDIYGLDEEYEPHHEEITEPGQVQVYETVLGDTRGEMTYTLLRADSYLKDNRIPPRGFSTAHTAYTDCAICGAAATDGDFNRSPEGSEGSGTDRVRYRISLDVAGTCTVNASLLYQTVSKRFTEDLVSHENEKTYAFEFMSDAVEYDFQTIATATMDVTATVVNEGGTRPVSFHLNRNTPNPFNGSTMIGFNLTEESRVVLTVFNIAGQCVDVLIDGEMSAGHHSVTWNGRDSSGRVLESGVYLYELRSGNDRQVRRMLYLK